jgi:hypothetical protein
MHELSTKWQQQGIEKILLSTYYQPNSQANTNGATIVASLSIMYFGV